MTDTRTDLTSKPETTASTIPETKESATAKQTASHLTALRETIKALIPIYEKMEAERPQEAYVHSLIFDGLKWIGLTSKKTPLLEEILKVENEKLIDAIHALNNDKHIGTGNLKNIVTILTLIANEKYEEASKTIESNYPQITFEEKVKKSFYDSLHNFEKIKLQEKHTLEIAELHKKNDELQKLLASSHSEQLLKITEQQQTITKQQDALAKKEEAFRNLSNEFNSLKELRDKIARLKKELETVTGQKSVCETEIKKLTYQIRDIEDKFKKEKEKAHNLALDKINDLKKTISSLEKEIKHYKNEEALLKETVKTLTFKNTDLENMLKILKAKPSLDEQKTSVSNVTALPFFHETHSSVTASNVTYPRHKQYQK